MIKPKFTKEELRRIRDSVFNSWDALKAETKEDIAQLWVTAIFDYCERRGDDYIPSQLAASEARLSTYDIDFDIPSGEDRQRAVKMHEAYAQAQLPLKSSEGAN